MEEENLRIGNTIRLKIGGKENLRGKNGIKCRGRSRVFDRVFVSSARERDRNKIVRMEKKDEEKREKGLEKKGRYRTRQGEIGRRYHTNRNVRGIINRLGSIGNPEKASLGAI